MSEELNPHDGSPRTAGFVEVLTFLGPTSDARCNSSHTSNPKECQDAPFPSTALVVCRVRGAHWSIQWPSQFSVMLMGDLAGLRDAFRQRTLRSCEGACLCTADIQEWFCFATNTGHCWLERRSQTGRGSSPMQVFELDGWSCLREDREVCQRNCW